MGRSGVFVVFVATATLAGCSTGAVPGGGSGTEVNPTFNDVPPIDTPGPQGGTWSGTITVTANIDYSKTEPGHSDLDPTNAYYEEWVTTEETQLDATDTFTVQGVDDDDLTYGVHGVDFEGSAENSGSTLQRYVVATDKQNSSCTWKQVDGDETAGSWSGSGDAVGDISFSEDGTYSINIRADSSDYAEVPERTWLEYSDISANCEISEPEYDTTQPGAPIIEWASSQLGQADADGFYAYIDGQMNVANPGSTVQGSKSWEFEFPEGLTLTAEWNLTHSIPIVLPNSGPDNPDLY